MKDDRFYIDPDKIPDIMKDETVRFSQLPKGVWKLLLRVAGNFDEWVELRQLVLQCMNSLNAGMRRKVLNRCLEELPFSLLIGDRTANLEELVKKPEPNESVSRKIYTLLTRRYMDVRKILKGLELFDHLGITAMIAEQCHAAVTIQRRYHPDYSLLTLVCRAMVYMMARFLPLLNTSKAATELKLERLENKKPQRTSGYNMVVRDAYLGVALTGSSMNASFEGGQDVIRTAAEYWKGLNDVEKQVHYLRGRDDARKKRKIIKEKIQVAEDKLHSLNRTEREAMAEFGAFRSTAGCKWNEDTVQSLIDVWESPVWGRARVQQHLDAWLIPPKAILAEEERSLLEFKSARFEERVLRDDVYEWTQVIATQAVHFIGCALQVGEARGERQVFLFANSSKQPMQAYFTPLYPTVPCDDWPGSEEDLRDSVGKSWVREWTFNPVDHMMESELTHGPEQPLFVLPDCRFGHGLLVGCDMDPILFSRFH